MSDIKILYVKLIKGGEKLEVHYKENGVVKSTNDKICEQEVHPDLINALNSLKPHFSILTDYSQPKELDGPHDLDRFTILGYSIGGKEETQGITLIGQRINFRGKPFTINVPFEIFDQAEDSRYLHMEDLLDLINVVEDEVKKLLFDGKRAPDQQGKLFDEIEPGEDEDEEQPSSATNIKILPADEDAQQRVSELDDQNGSATHTTKNKKGRKPKKTEA